MIRIAFYISNHGYGHATRMSALIEDFINAGIKCYIITDRPQEIFNNCNEHYSPIIKGGTDFGMVQKSWIDTDIEQTKLNLELLWGNKDEIINREMQFCRKEKINFIISDISFFPFEIAARLNLPSCGISNFEWHFIYRNVLKAEDKIQKNVSAVGTQLTVFDEDIDLYFIFEAIQKYYREADFAIKLPFSSRESMSAFNSVIEGDLLSYYRSPEVRKEIRAKLAKDFRLRRNYEIVLIAFGGYDDNPINLPELYKTGKYIFAKDFGSYNFKNYPRCRLIPYYYPFQDILAAADIIITKTGYSTFAEAVKHNKKLIYTGRKGNPEDKLLLEGIGDYPLGYYLPLSSLKKAPWKEILGELDSLSSATEVKEATSSHDFFKSDYSKSNRKVATTALGNLFGLNSKLKKNNLLISEKNNRYAIIDVGSNNIQLLWAEVTEKEINTVHRSIKTPAMAKDMKDGMISEEGLKRVKEFLGAYLDFSKAFTDNIIVIGTSSSRESKNINLLSDWVEQEYGVTYEIISEEREALLAGLANRRQFRKKSNMIFFDIGGGSTEFLYYKGNDLIFHKSLPLGVRRLINDFKIYDISPEEKVEELLGQLPAGIVDDPLVVGIGGTVTTIAAMDSGLREYDSKKVHKSKISNNTVGYYREKLMHFDDEEVAEMMPFEPERAEIIRMGLMIVEAIMYYLEVNNITVSDHGLVYGIAQEIKDKLN